MKSTRLIKLLRGPYPVIILIIAIWSLFFTRPACYGPAFAGTFARHHSGPGKLRPLAMVERRQTISLPRAHGEFYVGVIRTILEDIPVADKHQRINQFIGNLPPHLRRLYQKGIEKFYEQQRKNTALIRQHTGHEVEYLLGCVAKAENKGDAEIEAILANAPTADYIEPCDGVPFIEVEDGYYAELVRHGIIPPVSAGVALNSDDENEPSFIVVIKGWRNKASSTKRARHELHHFIRNLLHRSGFLRQINEATPELGQALKRVKSEFCSYIIEERSLLSGEIDAWALVYTDNKEIQAMALDAKQLVGLCIALAHKKGMPASDFIYAIESSRNFSEIEERCFAITPLQELTVMDIFDLVLTNETDKRLVDAAEKVMLAAKIVISKGDTEAWALGYLRPRRTILVLRDLKQALKYVSSRIQHAFQQDIDSERVCFAMCKERLPFLSDESIRFLMRLPQNSAVIIPLRATSHEQFAQQFNDIYSPNDPKNAGTAGRMEAYAEVFRHCPELAAIAEVAFPTSRLASEDSSRQAETELNRAI